MKRSWIGFFLLLVLLGIGILATWGMTAVHEPIEAELNQAAQLVLQGNWEAGAARFRQAKDIWETWEHFRTCFADHTPVEEIDGEFAMLEYYCLLKEDAAFAAGCRSLARKTAAVGEAHELVWWNLL